MHNVASPWHQPRVHSPGPSCGGMPLSPLAAQPFSVAEAIGKRRNKGFRPGHVQPPCFTRSQLIRCNMSGNG